MKKMDEADKVQLVLCILIALVVWWAMF